MKSNPRRGAAPSGEEDARSGCCLHFEVAFEKKKCNHEYVKIKFPLAD